MSSWLNPASELKECHQVTDQSAAESRRASCKQQHLVLIIQYIINAQLRGLLTVWCVCMCVGCFLCVQLYILQGGTTSAGNAAVNHSFQSGCFRSEILPLMSVQLTFLSNLWMMADLFSLPLMTNNYFREHLGGLGFTDCGHMIPCCCMPSVLCQPLVLALFWSPLGNIWFISFYWFSCGNQTFNDSVCKNLY